METWLWLLLAGLGVAWAFWRVRTLALSMAESLERKKPVLPEAPTWLNRLLGAEQLSRACFRLNDERARLIEQENQQLLQIESTLDRMCEALLMVDEEHRLFSANVAARELLGIASDATPKLAAVFQSVGLFEYLRAIQEGERLERREVSVVRGGETLWFEVSGTRIPGVREDQKYLALLILHDITRLKRLEGIRKEFVANVSHELRTPVTIIKGFTDTLLGDHALMKVEQRQRFLEKIHKNVERLHLLLEDLLTLSRLESGGSNYHPQRVDLQRLMQEVAESYAAAGTLRQVRLEMRLATPLPQVFCDGIKITQVLRNLVDNALRHAREATLIRIVAEPAGDAIRVVVEDNGCGIPAEDLPHIFERFYRVDKGRSRESGGTGLGLSIVKHIVLMHGGEVRAESVEGQGTRMAFTLPLDAAPPPDALT